MDDDDVFFADLSKQIALLITEDDDNDKCPVKQQRPFPTPIQGFAYVAPQAIMQPPLAFELAYRRESKGTGVFIPRPSLPRSRKTNRSGGRSSSSSRQLDKHGVVANRPTDNGSCRYSDYSYPSGVPKRNGA